MKKTILRLLIGYILLFAISCKKQSDNTTPPNPPTPTLQDNDPLLFGNPTNAQAVTTSSGNFLKNSNYYKISYNNARGTANWVAWHLQSDDLGTAPRQDDFRADLSLPSSFYYVQSTSYSGSGFDRGHNCPSADRTSTVTANSSTFLMTNMVPQAPNLNQGPWAALEAYIRGTLVGSSNEAYIFMGNFGMGGYNASNTLVDLIDAGHIVVPSKIWKVAVIFPKGANDLTRIDTSATVLAVVMPNDNRLFTTGGTNAWRSYIKTISTLEADAVAGGSITLDLLKDVPVSVKSYLKSKFFQ